ncbi:MAG: SRPBCC family protein [Mycobacteriales bacterium]
MWTFEHTERTTATADQIWTLYADPARWPEWDEGLSRVTLDGPFAVGTTGRIKPSGGPTFSYYLEEVSPERSFTDVTKLPLCRLRFSHLITQTPTGNDVTQRVQFAGPLGPLFAKLMGASMTNDMPATMRRMLRVAESVAMSA